VILQPTVRPQPYYTKIHGTPPAESDFQRFFRVTPPVVHQMIMTLKARGFIDHECYTQ
jgi:repressor LexA